jgi:hypothetical protein
MHTLGGEPAVDHLHDTAVVGLPDDTEAVVLHDVADVEEERLVGVGVVKEQDGVLVETDPGVEVSVDNESDPRLEVKAHGILGVLSAGAVVEPVLLGQPDPVGGEDDVHEVGNSVAVVLNEHPLLQHILLALRVDGSLVDRVATDRPGARNDGTEGDGDETGSDRCLLGVERGDSVLGCTVSDTNGGDGGEGIETGRDTIREGDGIVVLHDGCLYVYFSESSLTKDCFKLWMS